MASNDLPDVEEGDLEIKPEDLPPASIAGFFDADEIVFDRDQGIVKMDGEKYYLSERVAELVLSDD